jgi:hypothetical protein
MYLRSEVDEIMALVKDVLDAIVSQAESNKGIIKSSKIVDNRCFIA